jgi:adenylate cyclase
MARMAEQDPRANLPNADPAADARWRSVLLGDATGAPALRRLRRFFRHLPSDPRCKLCYAPYAAPFGPLVGRFGYGRWQKNPSLCGACMRVMERNQGGAEIELTLLFADVRGSTELATAISATEFGRVLNRFYGIAAKAIESTGGSVDKYLGDGVFALFIPGFSGADHAARAIGAAREILSATAHMTQLDEAGGSLPVGIGVHTGPAYVGVLGQAGDLTDFTALGEAVHVTERLSGVASARELLVSDAALAASGEPSEGWTRRELELKGLAGSQLAWSMTIGAPAGTPTAS